MMKTLVLLLGVCSAGCAAAVVGTTANIHVPKDAAHTCGSYCGGIGLSLNSVVIMASNVGCVCSAGPPQPSAGASSGGMAAIMMSEEQQNRGEPPRPGAIPRKR